MICFIYGYLRADCFIVQIFVLIFGRLLEVNGICAMPLRKMY